MVTTVVNDPGLVVGDVLDWTGAETFSAVVPSAALSKGDILKKDASTDPDSYSETTATTNIAGPFVMVLQDKASGITHASVVRGGTWACVADGNIEFGDDVMLSANTDHQVQKLTALDTTATLSESTVETAINYYKFKIGVSEGFADSYKTGSQVKAVDGDLVAVNTNRGY